MNGRPPKRQRRSAAPESEPQGDRPSSRSSTGSNLRPVALSSRPKPPLRARPSRAPANRIPSSPSSSPQKPSLSPKPAKSQSLHSFFQPATEGQRWSSQKFEAKRPLGPVTETTLDADEIEDDYDSYDEIFTQHLAGVKATPTDNPPASQGSGQVRRPALKAASNARPKSQPTKRFLMSAGSDGSTEKKRAAQTSVEVDRRPWAQRFAPSSLEELAVHKRKVSDVRNWLERALAGKSSERLLVLRGPAGAGKTSTLFLLAESLECDVIEWRNPSVSEFTARDYVSMGAQFEEFLGRGDRFGGLDLEDVNDSSEKGASSPRNRRVLLVEEFPTVLNRNSSSLAAFRTSIQRYLAAAADHSSGGWMHPPIVMVVSETLLSSTSSISDNLTVHRLLGPNLYNHPSTSIIDFNSIAPTFMQKALRSILEKESRMSQRARIPGPAVLDSISEIGDIRSAVSTLEFLCLKGDQAGKWSGSIAKTKKSRGDIPLTPMEQESLRMISQREASLGMFHAVGKIVYNKRLDASLMPADSTVPVSPPDHLSHHRRVKVSQVAVNDLIDETGTDISTFICALHENYPPSCDGDDFTDSLNSCIEALSDSDILGADRRPVQGARAGIGIGSSALNAGVDMLRQDEISFQVATRGLLFALPCPVKRRLTPVDGHGRPGDAHKMLYPSSLRQWRKTEEIEGLVDSWMKHLIDPFKNQHLSSRITGASAESTGVKAWRSLKLGHHASANGKMDGSSAATITMMSRNDMLLHQLPYMAHLRRHDPDGWQLNRITQIRGSRLDDVDDDDDDDELSPTKPPNKASHGTSCPQPSPLEEKLILSDDDIVDD